MDVHNLAAFQNAFRIPTDNLEAKNLLVEFLAGPLNTRRPKWAMNYMPERIPNDVVVLSPDSGGMHRAKSFRTALEKKLGRENQIDVAYVDKERKSDSNDVEGDKIVGDVSGKKVIIVDDMISTGGTLILAKKTIEKFGGEVWAAVATHGLFFGDAKERMQELPRVVVTDTCFREELLKGDFPWTKKDASKTELWIVPTAQMFAQAIHRTHEDGGSISELLG